MNTYEAGNLVRASVIFVPESGEVALADVRCTYRTNRMEDYEPDLSVTADVVRDSANHFHVDIQTADDDPGSTWYPRFRSVDPSATIATETNNVFRVLASKLLTPGGVGASGGSGDDVVDGGAL